MTIASLPGREEFETLGRVYDGALMRRLLGYVAPYRLQVAAALGVLLVLSVTEIAPPIIFKYVIDSSIAPAIQGTMTPADATLRLATLGGVYVAALVGQALLRYADGVLVTIIGQRAMRDLRNALFRHLQGQSMAFFDQTPVGRLVTRLTNDVDALSDMVSEGVVALLGDAFLLGVIALALMALDLRLALVTFLSLPIVGAITILIRRRMRRSFREMRLAIARVNAFLNEHLSGMATDQLFCAEVRGHARFEVLNQEYRRASLGALVATSLFQPLVGLTRTWTSAVLFLVGGYWVLRGEMSIGTLVAFWQLIDRFFQPVEDLSDKYTILQAAMASAERIFRLLDTPPTVIDPPDPVRLERVRGEIGFEDVSFAYVDDDWVLRDVDLRIAAGESVAIVGATGAGKTSIISLLSRFYDVQHGRILLDGVDIRSVRQADLRSHIGVVLQDPFIFAGTIASNIRLQNGSISDEQVRAAARFVNADAFIERLPNGYDTTVTERGSTMSVGQKQLLAFARAIAFNPEIILVLDEATSSVDTETEQLIQDALRRLMRNRTSVVIAHRLSTIRDVDRIIVLSRGRVVETGTHRALLAQKGVYRRLYELQYRATR